MKTIVAYKSKSGYTKTYAEWIAQELHCDIKENAELSDLAGYDTIIYGGGMYAGGFPCCIYVYTAALFSKALVGMQPQLRHVPPISAFSTTPTFFPSCEALIAAT